MDIKTLFPFEDVLTVEMGNIVGGNDPVKKEPVTIECKGDGVVHLPSTKLALSIF